jgi:hypothetical protein
MTWVKHSDDFSSNPKVIGLTDKAYRLHFCALEYCSRHLTDGLVTPLALRSISVSAGLARPKSTANALVRAGLWKTQRSKGWTIHDYLEYNPRAEVVKAERKKAAARMQRVRAERAVRSSPERSQGTSRSPSRPLTVSNETGTNSNGRYRCELCVGGLEFKSQGRLDDHLHVVHEVDA